MAPPMAPPLMCLFKSQFQKVGGHRSYEVKEVLVAFKSVVFHFITYPHNVTRRTGEA